VFTLSLTLGQVVGNIGVAFLCGMIISYIYRGTHKGMNAAGSFVHSVIILSMITALVIMVIGNNLARAFGLVGSMSIIRFRTAVKDTQDIVYLFFSLAVGMAAGAGYYMIAFAGTFLIGGVLAGLSMTDYGMPHRHEFLLQFTYTGPEGGEAPYIRTFVEYAREHRLINAKTQADGASIELSYYVRLRDHRAMQPFIKALSRVEGVEQVNCFFDEG
jgi:uncharacterized membrane protein YhiD involved in acid resistance